MHEQSIVSSLLALAIENAEKDEARKIVGINLVVGELTGVEENAVNFYFNFLSKDTIAEGAKINYNFTKARLRCRECDVIFPRDRRNFRCPRCDQKAVEIIGGRELTIESLEVI